MILGFVTRALLSVAAVFCLPLIACAATLHAKVVEVSSGNELIVTNINRSLMVRLNAVVPPESGQRFNDVAREHLKALVLDKPVVIEYTHFVEGYLVAKVILNGIDIGSQMLRDGAAWYDRASEHQLKQADRELYDQCEQAARNEKRGLWQDPSPVSPWDFRKGEIARATMPALPSPSQPRARKSERSSLSSNDLIGGGLLGPGSIAGNPSARQISPKNVPGEWIRFQFTAQNSSFLVPGNSYEYEYPVLDGQKKIVNIYYAVGTQDGTLYVVMRTKGSNSGATDASIAADTLAGLLMGVNRSLESGGQTVRAVAGPGREMKLSGYAGKQYSVTMGHLSAVVRVVSKQIGDQREVFMLAAFMGPGSEVSGQFLGSLKIEN